jgi:hypothetical protein
MNPGLRGDDPAGPAGPAAAGVRRLYTGDTQAIRETGEPICRLAR